MRHEWVVRMDYGQIIPWVRRRDDPTASEVITAVAGPDKLILRGPRLPIGDRAPPRRRVRRRGGRDADLLDDLDPVVRAHAAERRPTDRADDRRRERVGRRCHDDVPHADVVRRSLLTLRLLTHEQTGGIVAAPDHLAARGLRRRAQLGLPLLLAARRGADHRVADRRGLHRRGQAVAALAAARGGRRPRGPADHVRRRRRPTPARARRSTTCPATRARGRCGSATARSSSSRPTCWAR